MPSSDALLRLGVEDSSRIRLPFDLAATRSAIALPFDIERDPVSSRVRLPFDIAGLVASGIRLPFDLEGPTRSEVRLPFDVLADAVVGGSPTPSGGIVATTLAVDAHSGETVIVVTDPANIRPGMLLQIVDSIPGPVPPPPPPPITGGPDPDDPFSWSGWTGVPFASRPASGALTYSGATDLLIENKTFSALGANVIAVALSNCRRVIVRNCDFDGVAECVFGEAGCEDLTLVGCRYRNILGPSLRDGHHRANFLQYGNSHRAYVAHNKGYNTDTEDIVNFFQSDGDPTSPILCEYNWFEGRGWTSRSGTGFILGDAGGNYQVARFNRLLTPGQVGIGVVGGIGHQVLGNTLYARSHSAAGGASNVGIGVYNGYGVPTHGIVVADNRVKWFAASGSENPFWDGGTAGVIEKHGNDFSAALDPLALVVSL